MRKFLKVCIFCFISILITYIFLNTPQVSKKVITPVLETINEYTQEEIPYTSDFVINDIDIKNEDYYYNTLDKNCQAIYKSLANAVKELKTEFYIKDYEFESTQKAIKDIEETMHNFLLDHPEVFYLDEKYLISTSQSILGNQVSLQVTYTVKSKEELNNKINQIKTCIQEIINTVNIGVGTTFEKELRIHDVLARKVKYYEYENVEQIPHSAHTIYGAFVENTAVCDGISKALQVLLDNINVESIIITGVLDNEAHAWNMVKLEDSWYNVDITSNKSIKDYDDIVIHSYFNITTDEIKKTHTIDEPSIVPIANNDKYNYFVVLDKIITNNDDFNVKLKSILNNNIDLEKIEYKVKNIDKVPEKTIEVLRNGKYNQYLDWTLTKFVYYNILDNYVIIKR